MTAVTALSDIEIRTNPSTLQKLGLHAPVGDADQAVADAQ